ncbi:hypothetical protein CLIB1423_11S01398 [[Candida] railenensis]|uniref:Alcohol acetyltransferase n=1 Tax=[Candida] railenensis TaxID=45579 RepID=A0A9P0QRC9_9ASCO|nr:hypothetical protein CLIB1423_11S01398 [[Candida] railenensis]
MDPKHIRDPGFLERQYICRNTNKYWTNFNIVAKYNQKVDAQLLSRALRKLCLSDLWLVLNFFRKYGDHADDHNLNGVNFEVRPVKQFKFEDVVSFEHIPSFDGTFLEKVNELVCPMNTELPLWRIIVVSTDANEQYICIYFDHSIFDGTAGVHFQRFLIDQLNKIHEGNDTEVVSEEYMFNYVEDIDRIDAIVPSAKENTNSLFQTSIFYRVNEFLKQLWKRVRRYLPFQSKSSTLTFSHNVVTRNMSAKYRTVTIPSSDVGQVLKFCKGNGFTMTPLINVIALKALEGSLFKGLGLHQNRFPSTISCLPINGRKFVNNPSKLGVYVGYDFFQFPSPISNLVTFSQDLYGMLNRTIRSKSCFSLVGMYKHVNIWDTYKSKLGKKDGRATIAISNLGRMEQIPSSGSEDEKFWQIEDIWFSSCMGLVLHSMIYCITCANGNLNLVFGFLPEYELYLDKFVSEFRRILDNEVLSK